MPTKDQLRSIEWAGKVAGAKACPACGWGWCDPGKHAPDCWLAAALATPDTLPPVAVADHPDIPALWFLLYGGSSEDGSGGGVYVGKTADPSVAREHAREVRRSPYSTGYVLVVTDTAVHRCHSVDDVIRRTKEAANGRD